MGFNSGFKGLNSITIYHLFVSLSIDLSLEESKDLSILAVVSSC